MLWKIYVWIFAAVNILSLISFNYSFNALIGLFSLLLSVGLNIAVFSYAYKKPILPVKFLDGLFKANIALIALFVAFEFITFLQEVIGSLGLDLPTSGLVAVIASFPSIPALYATYKMSHAKKSSKTRKKSKKN